MPFATTAQKASPPQFGTFYSVQKPHQPALPFNPRPELPLVEITDGIFVFDDTSVDYAGESMMMVTSSEAPPAPGGGGGPSISPTYSPTVPIPGVPLIKIETLDQGVKLVSFNTKTNFLYRVEATDNLSNPAWTTIEEFVATETNSHFTVNEGQMRFYRVYQESDFITFPDWFDSIWQFMEFKAQTTATDGMFTFELFADGRSLGSGSQPIAPGQQTLRVYDGDYDPAEWPNTGYYGVSEWRLLVGVTPATPPGVAATTTHINVRKKGRQRNPRDTYRGAVANQNGIFNVATTVDQVDEYLLNYAGALYQPTELVSLGNVYWEPIDVTQIQAHCRIWGTNEWAQLLALVTGLQTGQYIDYLHYLGHGNSSRIGISAAGQQITKIQLQNSALSSNAMTYVALDACRAADGTDFLKAWTSYGTTIPYAVFFNKGLDPKFGCSWTKTKGVEWVNQGTLIHNHFYFWADWYKDLTRRDAFGLMYKRYKQAYQFAKEPKGDGVFSSIQENPEATGFKMVGCDECRFDERPGTQ